MTANANHYNRIIANALSLVLLVFGLFQLVSEGRCLLGLCSLFIVFFLQFRKSHETGRPVNPVCWIAIAGTIVLFLLLIYLAVPKMVSYNLVDNYKVIPSLTALLLFGGLLFFDKKPDFNYADKITALAVILLSLLQLNMVLPSFLRLTWSLFTVLLVVSVIISLKWFRYNNTVFAGGTLFDSKTVLWSGAIILFVLVVFTKSAWICDDAFITFRTIDNFHHGYGLVWNGGERVQSYTHPLWFLVLTLARAAGGNLYYAAICLGIVFSLAAVIIVLQRFAKNRAALIIAVCFFTFSKAFVDYATSGLENALSYFLIVLFMVQWTRMEWTRKSLFIQSLLASLLMTNRMDLILLIGPAYFWTLWNVFKAERFSVWKLLLAGWMPFLLWEVFSVVYYGFPFPNTAYAKMGASVSATVLMAHGFKYILNAVRIDPITTAVLLTALISPLFQKKKVLWFLIAGMALYLIYIFKIGGDFMSGRFLTAPFLMAVLVLLYGFEFKIKTALTCFASIMAMTLILPHQPWGVDKDYIMPPNHHGIADERGFYFDATGLLKSKPGSPYGNVARHPFKLWQRVAQKAKAREQRVITHGAVGILGYEAGPEIYVIDQMALGNALLARLPVVKEKLRIGHYRRKLPGGYYEMKANGEGDLINQALNAYYYKLQVIISSPVWSVERFREIIKVNLGFYKGAVNKKYYMKDRYAIEPVFENETTYGRLINNGMSVFVHEWDYWQALKDFEQAQALEPAKPAAYVWQAMVYLYRGQLEKAEILYEQAYGYDGNVGVLIDDLKQDWLAETGYSSNNQ